ncbi:hypothetical protein BH18ACT15_BH18ACT15_11380 [soil metagenome]
MTHRVRLEVFEGPIDLLLHLITRQRVDIYEVSLASITEEYLDAVRGLSATDLDTATGFLVVAATLLELKSARLLPVHREGEDQASLLEERDLLLARLVECSTFRGAGGWIGAGLISGARSHPRMAGLEPRFVDLAPDLLAKTTPPQVAQAAARVLARPPEPDIEIGYVAPVQLSVRAAIVELAGRLLDMGAASFPRLCPPRPARAAVVVRFLALLELYKAGAVELSQAGRFGDIEVVWTGLARGEDVALEAHEYTAEATPSRSGQEPLSRSGTEPLGHGERS